MARRCRIARRRFASARGTKHGGGDPARQFNIEYRAADAIANPYLALGAIVRAGLDGIERPAGRRPSSTGRPGRDERGRARTGSASPGCRNRSPRRSTPLEADAAAAGWLAPTLLDSHARRQARARSRHLADRSAEEASRALSHAVLTAWSTGSTAFNFILTGRRGNAFFEPFVLVTSRVSVRHGSGSRRAESGRRSGSSSASPCFSSPRPRSACRASSPSTI